MSVVLPAQTTDLVPAQRITTPWYQFFFELNDDLAKADAAIAGLEFDDLIHIISPQQYGATGDGNTDDTLAMQAWLDAIAATGGNTPGYLPEGNYKITSEIVFPLTDKLTIF